MFLGKKTKANPAKTSASTSVLSTQRQFSSKAAAKMPSLTSSSWLAIRKTKLQSGSTLSPSKSRNEVVPSLTGVLNKEEPAEIDGSKNGGHSLSELLAAPLWDT